MRQLICEMVNRFFYNDHPLRTDPSTAHESSALPFASVPLLYVDTAPYHPWTALRVGTYSRYNLFHALLLRNVVLHLAEQGYLPHEGEPNNAVGIVAPYASQARLVQSLLEDRLGRRATGVAATVHRFQGNEKKTILIDLTDSLGTPLGRFLKAARMEEDGSRLLNVAVSRARHHVVLVANFDYLRAKAPRDAIVRCLLDHFQEHGAALDVEALLPLADRDWIDGLHQTLTAAFELPNGAAGAFTEETFYPAFWCDLERVRESLVLFSPFATTTGTSRWVEPLALPDIEIGQNGQKELQVRVALKGVALFDLKRHTTEYKHANSGYVSAWYLDEDYDGDCFVDCQMFFDFKKKSATSKLGLDVDDEEFTLKLASEPFPVRGYRRIAVKVVDVYGNESTVVRDLG
jgi:hypothetical protein